MSKHKQRVRFGGSGKPGVKIVETEIRWCTDEFPPGDHNGSALIISSIKLPRWMGIYSAAVVYSREHGFTFGSQQSVFDVSEMAELTQWLSEVCRRLDVDEQYDGEKSLHSMIREFHCKLGTIDEGQIAEMANAFTVACEVG